MTAEQVRTPSPAEDRKGRPMPRGPAMQTFINRIPVAAAMGLIAGLLLGSAVGAAMTWNRHLYLRFIGLLVIVMLGIIGTWVYRTYLRPSGAHVEEMGPGEVDPQS
jgi:hypothetical protein